MDASDLKVFETVARLARETEAAMRRPQS